VRRCVA